MQYHIPERAENASFSRARPRFDRRGRADSLIVGQTFPVKSRDVIYAARHNAVDFNKFLSIVSGPISIVTQGAVIGNAVGNLSH